MVNNDAAVGQANTGTVDDDIAVSNDHEDEHSPEMNFGTNDANCDTKEPSVSSSSSDSVVPFINDTDDQNNEVEGEDAIPSFSSKFMYTTDQKWTVRLLKILDDANAPDYAFGHVLEWARESSLDGYSYQPMGGLSRARNVDALIHSVRNGDKILPYMKRVEVKGEPSDVICFDFVAQILSLLQNRSIMTEENLAIDIHNPLKPYFELKAGAVLGEAISGSVYRDAYKRLIRDPTRQLFVPIIQWIDRTTVTGNERFSLKPYMFTPAIFSEKFRRSIKAWGYHGFLPKRKCSSAQLKTLKMGDSLRKYHTELRAALESFRTCSERLRGVYLPIGPKGVMKVDIVTCVLFIIQDMQEGDMLCGRYGNHQSGVRRQHRSCDVTYESLPNSNVCCTYLKAWEMHEIEQDEENEETRKQWSQHRIQNAFVDIPFADPERGIFGATPVETMHAFRKGVVEKVTRLILDNVPPSKKAAFDNLAIIFHKSHRQTHRKNYPATDFSNGVTNLTKITATERLGLVFLFVILFQYDQGWRMIQGCLEKKTTNKVPEVLEVLECILCFDAWLNQSQFWETCLPPHELKNVMGRCQASIQQFMDMCKAYIPLKVEKKSKKKKDSSDNEEDLDDVEDIDDTNNNGQQGRKRKRTSKKKKRSKGIDSAEGDDCAIIIKKEGKKNFAWNFPKFHELLHIVDDISRFGAPINFCAQRAESLLIPAAKQPGRRAQKRKVGSAYELQAAQRLMYSFMIKTVHTRIWEDHDSNSISEKVDALGESEDTIYEGTGQATFGHVSRHRVGPQYHYSITWNCKTHTDLLSLPPQLIEFVCHHFKFLERVRFCTEYVRDIHTFRCHPCYQSDGPIYDWMIINFDGHNYPCRLALVVVLDKTYEGFEDKYQLIVQSTTEEVEEHESNLLREWKWSPTYHAVPSSTVVAPCFVISISHDNSTVLETKAYSDWASMFT